MDAATIIATARQIMRGPRVAGRADCLFDVARLVAAISGRNMLGALLVVYDTEAEAKAMADYWGGLLRASDDVLTEAGMRRVDQPTVGDVALVPAPGVVGAAFAVAIGRRAWLTRGENGPAIVKADPLGAWAWA